MNPRILCGLLLPTCAVFFSGCGGQSTTDYETTIRQQIGDANKITVTVSGTVPTAPAANPNVFVPTPVPTTPPPGAPIGVIGGNPVTAPGGAQNAAPLAPGVHEMNLSIIDRQIWAANLHIGPSIAANPAKFDEVVTFTTPKYTITWKINAVITSTDPNATPVPPGSVVTIKGTGEDTSEYTYLLTAESNKFAQDWFKAHPPA